MRALLDTNIIIHRENNRVSNYSIGHLFRWLDKLRYEKVIHPYSIEEISKYRDPDTQTTISVKLEAYEVLKTVDDPNDEFLNQLGAPVRSENDIIDNCLLYELFLGKVDILITEDRRMRNKASNLGIGDKVFSINSFISFATAGNPNLVDYKMLAVRKTCFGKVDVQDSFFDNFRVDYPEFDKWFLRKCDEEAYICFSDDDKILGFLYLKTENENENYADISPNFDRKKRLKVGTFKVESTGFRLGERFVKIIFDNALQRDVDEIYVTLYTDRDELVALEGLLKRWGFVYYGMKGTGPRKETVLVKRLGFVDSNISTHKNFPNIKYGCDKYILPICSEYHTDLLPDSKLNNENEVDFLGKDPHKYALQKVYITWAVNPPAKPGDLILFYRMGEQNTIKKHTSVLTSVAIVDEIISSIPSEKDLLSLCQNRSVFSTEELKSFWRYHGEQLKIVRFIFVKSLAKRLNLNYLWTHNIIMAPNGPRPFTSLTDEQYNQILDDSGTRIKYV